jgi:phosphate uptake regulator
MKRKIVKQGAATLTVSIPNSWVKKFQLRPGDELEVEERKNQLILMHSHEAEVSSQQVDITDLDPLVSKILCGIYRKGADEVKVVFGKPDLFNRYRKALNEYVGFEVTEQGKNYCVLREIVKTSGIEFENIFQRIFFLLKSCISDTIQAFKDQDFEVLKNMYYRDVDVNKLVNFCLRHINKVGYKDFEKNCAIYATIHQLEAVGDRLKEFAGKCSEENITVRAEYLEVLSVVNELFEAIHKVVQKSTVENAKNVAHIYDRLKPLLDKKLKQTNNKKETIFVMHCKVLAETIILISDINMGFLQT